MRSNSDSIQRDGKAKESSSPSSFYRRANTRPIRKRNTPPEIETEEYEEKTGSTFKILSTPFVIKSGSSSSIIPQLKSFPPQYPSLHSETPSTPRTEADLNTVYFDSPDCSSSELLSEVMLPPAVETSPLCLEIAENNLEISAFKVIVYLVSCFYDKKQVQLFFNSDQFLDPMITNEDKDIFFQIALVQLTPDQAKILKHRKYIKDRLIRGDVGDTLPYLEALATGKKDLAVPFSDNMMLNVKADYLLQSLCGSYLFFEFLFSATSKPKIDNEIFTLFKNFNLKATQVDTLHEHIIAFLYSPKQLYVLSLNAMWTLINLLNDWLEMREKIDSLLNALTSTHKGHRLLRAMNQPNVDKFLDFLKRTGKMKTLFSKMVNILELAASIMNSSTVKSSEIKQEFSVFATLEEAIYFIHSLPSSSLMEELLIRSSEQERKRFLNILWDLNLAVTDTLLFKKAGFVHRLKIMEKEEELVQRIKRWFSFATLTASPEIQRAFMSNADLMESNHKKLQIRQTLLINAEQAKTIQNLRYAILLNELKAKWVTYFKVIWTFLLEHWEPRSHLLCAHPLRDSFRKIMLDGLERSEPSAYNPKFYQLSNLPVEMTTEILQDSILTQEYQGYLDKMTKCYEQMTACRKQSEIAAADPFPKIKGYTSFKDLLRLLTPDLSADQALVLRVEFTQLFLKMRNDDSLSINWSEKDQSQLPQMLYISSDLSQEAIGILRTYKIIKLSKLSFNTDYHFKKDRAKEAILKIHEKICETMNLIERISLPSGRIEGFGL